MQKAILVMSQIEKLLTSIGWTLEVWKKHWELAEINNVDFIVLADPDWNQGYNQYVEVTKNKNNTYTVNVWDEGE